MERQNVLLIVVDQWPGALLGIGGRTDIETPTLDQLARNGTRFPNMHSECPICIPARRSLMTGTSPRVHGDRVFQPKLTKPNIPHMAEVFRSAGYQTGSVGKLHVFPSRDRIGFEETILFEEGRPGSGGPDDWDIWIADQGHAGLGYAHGMSNNSYEYRPWHLGEDSHPTIWLSRQFSRMIQRRDPVRPAFWNLSYNFPHPPIVPLASYLNRYNSKDTNPAIQGDWNEDLPYALEVVQAFWPSMSAKQLEAMRRAFYAQCTLIDHQLRLVIGTLREHGILDNTIIAFTSDHGDMLGDHNLFGKRVMLSGSTNIPLILVGAEGDDRLKHGAVDNRLAGIQDIMPTLLDLTGVECPNTCTGRSLVSGPRRKHLYCEALEGPLSMRMVVNENWKLIWYPAGNDFQLFNRSDDPNETRNLAGMEKYKEVQNRLTDTLKLELYGKDREWLKEGDLIGIPAPKFSKGTNRGLWSQRGLHYPQPPGGLNQRPLGSPPEAS